MDRLLSKPNPISALFVVNNSLAKACLTYFKNKQISVPEDVAIITFDDIDVFQSCAPTITAIAKPLEKIRDYAVQLLLNKIKDPRVEDQEIILAPKLILRQSSELKHVISLD